MSTFRFNTWIEADAIQEAWGKLVTLASECEMRKKSFKKEFTVTQLEDGEQDKKELAPLTVKELRDYAEEFIMSCRGCALYDEDDDTCWLDNNCPQLLKDKDIDEMAKKIRGEKE